MSDENEEHDKPVPKNRWRQLAWFVALWIGGVAVVGTVAFVIRTIIKLQFPSG